MSEKEMTAPVVSVGADTEHIRNISTKTRPEGGALNLILDRWVASCADVDESVVNAQLAPLEEMVHGFDFTRMLRRYRIPI